jgi:outer membrane protein assembly factor BamB
MIFTRGGKSYVCFGSKNGSFFILDADTMSVVARRQLLPKDSAGRLFRDVDPPEDPNDPPEALRENKSGVFGTAALDSHLDHLFIGLGGYGEGAIDHKTTPFIRAMKAMGRNQLEDAWPVQGTDPPKYRAAQPPVYSTPDEPGLSSPAVVNDVIFVSTTKPALYAFDAQTGLCLWKAPDLTPVPFGYALGPAIYGNFVVNGTAERNRRGHLYIYSLWPRP